MRTTNPHLHAIRFVAACIALACCSSQAEDASNAASAVSAADSPLNELAWVVGDWADEADSDRVQVECRWTRNGHFITRRFLVVDEADQPLLEGTQVIGWDPSAERIRSWTFDSEGGFGEASWSRDGDRWLIKTNFTLASGERASALNILTRIDNDTATWESVNREVAGKIQPNQPEITVVRSSSPEVSPASESSQ